MTCPVHLRQLTETEGPLLSQNPVQVGQRVRRELA